MSGIQGPDLARAKVNLRLRVLSSDDEGFHSIETVLLRLDLHDDVELERGGEGIELDVGGDAADGVPAGPENLCWRAIEAFRRVAPREPAGWRIRLRKRIPTGSGLGGGSADAAAVLRLINRQARRPLTSGSLLRVAGELGSDVPFALLDVPAALAWGRGRRLLPLSAPPPLPGLVVLPPFRVSTVEAYGWVRAARAGGRASRAPASVLPGPSRLAEWGSLARIAANDFEEHVFSRHPELAACRHALERGGGTEGGDVGGAGALVARMTGSGSALFAVYPDIASRAEAARAVEAAGCVPAEGWKTLEATLPG